MGRQAKYSFMLNDQKTRVGYSLKWRGDMVRIQFPDPEAPEKHREVSTGCRTLSDAHLEGLKIVNRAYAGTITPDSKNATWDEVLADLANSIDLRPRSLEVYRSTVAIFRRICTKSKGPGDVTVELAKWSRRQYQITGFTRSEQEGAKVYPRSPKTVENFVRRLSGLWSHLRTLGYVESNPWVSVSRPTVPKKSPFVPSDEDVAGFFRWVDTTFPGWELLRLFFEVKALSGCRLNDLCQVRSNQFDPIGRTLTIKAEQDKTHRERVIPIPSDLSDRLHVLKGTTYLWERYNADCKQYWWGAKSQEAFSPAYLYNSLKSVFQKYAKTGGRLRSHGFRKRAITLTTQVTQSVDATAQAIGIDAQTARRYYLDAQRAFDGSVLLKQMASVLRPKQVEEPPPIPEQSPQDPAEGG